MLRKKTHEEYVAEVATINVNIEVIDQYINSDTKIKHRCKIDQHEWYARPSTILKGTGCPICGTRAMVKAESKTHDSYVKEVALINPNIIVIGRYINAKTKVKHRCKIDDYEWDAAPTNILRGKGCPKCAGSIRYRVDEVKYKLHIVNPYIEMIGNYVNMRTPVLCHCLVDGYEWMAVSSNLCKGVGCPMCAKKAPYTTESFVAKMATVNNAIEIIGQYTNAKTKILCKCKIDGCEWEGLPSNLIRGEGCPKCGVASQTRMRTKTHDQYIREVAEINPDIEVIEPYINIDTRILHRCKKDGTEWKVSPNSILSGTGCPRCNDSRGEREIRLYLDRHNIAYICQYRFNQCRSTSPLPFDFYLPDLNMCIEYDGIQHFKAIDYFGGEDGFLKYQARDNIKNNFCKTNNISLLRIRYDQSVQDILNNFFEQYKTINDN